MKLNAVLKDLIKIVGLMIVPGIVLVLAVWLGIEWGVSQSEGVLREAEELHQLTSDLLDKTYRLECMHRA